MDMHQQEMLLAIGMGRLALGGTLLLEPLLSSLWQRQTRVGMPHAGCRD